MDITIAILCVGILFLQIVNIIETKKLKKEIFLLMKSVTTVSYNENKIYEAIRNIQNAIIRLVNIIGGQYERFKR